MDDNFVLNEKAKDYDPIMVRSADLKEENFSKNYKAIAHVGAGGNNIPIDRCISEGIAVFITPGGNANAVIIARHMKPSRGILLRMTI